MASRIVGGVRAKLGSWPWIAAIGYNIDVNKTEYLCGGTLITKRHVVTAAHCIRDDLDHVLLGELILEDDSDGAKPQKLTVVNVTRHPKYDSRAYHNDIAILELEKDFKPSDKISPICLTDDPDIVKKFEDTAVKIAGWGAVQFRGPSSDRLLEGVIRPVTLKECKEVFEKFRNVEIDEDKYCARDLQGKIDACQGDSGGPLTAKIFEEPFRTYLVGVTSFGYRCAHPGFPGVYTRVSNYLPWIKRTI